jgi:predicted phosphohydrolase
MPHVFGLCETRGMTIVEPIAPEESRLFFGNSYMNAVIIEIAALEGDTFSPKQIVQATGLIGSIVHPLIHKLRDAHFLEFVGRVPGERTLLYRINDNYWWEAARRYASDRQAAAERSAS